MNEVRDPQTYAIIGAALEVHNHLGCGFLEAVYQESLQVEFTLREIPFRRKCKLELRYKGHVLDCRYEPDLICFEDVIVELKALDSLGGVERSQILNYLKATGHHRGLLINFGCQQLQFERFVWTEPTR